MEYHQRTIEPSTYGIKGVGVLVWVCCCVLVLGQIASRNVHQHIFCCDKETAWIKITFLVKTIVRCVLVDGDLGRGVNPGVSKYGGPNEWSSGLVVKDEKGNVVTGIVGVQKPSSSSSSSSSSDGGS